MPGVCGKVVPPELPEEGVVLVLRPSGLIVVGIVPSEHVEVGTVGHAAMAAPGRGAPVACRRRRRENSSRRAQVVSQDQELGWFAKNPQGSTSAAGGNGFVRTDPLLQAGKGTICVSSSHSCLLHPGPRGKPSTAALFEVIDKIPLLSFCLANFTQETIPNVCI